MFAFLPDDMDVNLALETHYSASLVLLSYLIASTAAFTALNMADRLSESSGRARQVWLWVGASAMGVGIWAMHFIGMLAFQLPVEVKYNLVITVASVIPGVLASAVAIHQISEGNKRYLKVLKGGLFMGAGIGGMHYIGMAGMEVTAMMYYRFDLFVVSIVVAVLLATIAILPRVWASKYQGTTYERYYHIGSMMIMGLAVAGMHYTAMASVVFFPSDLAMSGAVSHDGLFLDPTLLSSLVVIVAFSVLVLAFVSSVWGKKLNEAQVSLQAYELANTLKDDFLSTISHELLTPINGVRMGLSLLEDYVDRGGEEYYGAAIKSNLQMQYLIEKIILFSQARAGNLQVHKKLFRPRELIAEVQLNYDKNNGNDVSYDCDDYVPEWVVGDEKKVLLLITELMKNATHFTHDGKIILGCALEKRNNSDNGSLVISVTDNGEGIEASMQSYIFEAFGKAGKVSTRASGGVGIGLTLSGDLLRLMNGSIELHSVVGDGTRFNIKIPIEKASSNQIEAHICNEKYRRSDEIVGSTSTILVVEDNGVNMALLLKVLEKLKYKTVSATNGKMALDVLKDNNEVSAVLMDCQMPIMDGYEATRSIRYMSEYRDLPIIAVTANVSDVDRQRCQDSGMNDFLAKPVTPSIIGSTLAKWIH